MNKKPFGFNANGWNGADEKQRWRNVMLQKKCIAIFVFEKWFFFSETHAPAVPSTIHNVQWHEVYCWFYLFLSCMENAKQKCIHENWHNLNAPRIQVKEINLWKTELEETESTFVSHFSLFALIFTFYARKWPICFVLRVRAGNKNSKWARQSMTKKSRLVTRQSLSHIRDSYLVAFGDCGEQMMRAILTQSVLTCPSLRQHK